ncbi:MAG: LPS-assembly protein LptD [Nitrospirae bacterium]|nr:LPS-assembly protein LptD [Nitrospirota bacterium]
MQKNEKRKTGWLLHVNNACLVLFCLFWINLLISAAHAEDALQISSDLLEYLSKDNTYTGRGNVLIQFKGQSLKADEVLLNYSTSDTIASGNVIYESPEAVINASKLELNIESRLGTIYDAYMLYKKRNIRIRGGNIKKTGEENYEMDRADITTCESVPPEWHISTEDIKVVQHKKLTSRNTKFYIKDLPVLYTPYFTVPLLGKRETGVLNPSLGYTNTKGFTYNQGFFWAIGENKDATFYIDIFSSKGLGKGIDYRYISAPENFGEIWLYHLRDNDLSREFSEVKSYHNRKLFHDISSYLKIHMVNEFDYYDILESTPPDRFGFSSKEPSLFGFISDERQQKFLESNLHFSKPFESGRIYLSSQYRQNLEGSSGTISQSLPEFGAVLNTQTRGPASFNIAFRGTNFWKEEGQKGLRLDLKSNLFISFGRTVSFSQRAGLRETAYFLTSPDKNKNSQAVDLSSSLSTRFIKRFKSFNHIVEPAIEYDYIPDIREDDIETFDSTDSVPETSGITYSLTNRIAGADPGGLEARFRLSQGYSLLGSERPLTPVSAEGSLSSKNTDFKLNVSYDVYDNRIADTIASLNLKNDRGYIGLGKNFRRSTLLDQYSIEGALYYPITIYNKNLPLEIGGKLWYDLKGGGIQELNLKTSYKRQCWGFAVTYSKKPHEYEIMFGIEFTGLGTVQLG